MQHSLMTDIVSGHPAIDGYLADGYARIRGMSSRFAAAICGHVVRRQSALGIGGHMVEIGPFEGRFFIAMALGLAAGEIAVGIDVFDWPDPGVRARFLDNCRACGLDPEQVVAWQADSGTLAADALRARLNGPARFIHIDGTHACESLAADLEIAHAVLHPSGIIAIDDMLHPGYPTLVTAVLDFLTRHPEMRVLCIIDREDIVAAAKFLLCRADAIALYEPDLMETFARFHFILGADMVSHLALVLTPHPRLAEIG
jgi:predicted O-methyltransferase YrrM